jgi:hypothetical protein
VTTRTGKPVGSWDGNDCQVGSECVLISKDSRARLPCGVGFGPLIRYRKFVPRALEDADGNLCQE